MRDSEKCYSLNLSEDNLGITEGGRHCFHPCDISIFGDTVYENVYLATFLLKVANLNLVSDLSSYFSWRGLKVLIDARTLPQGMV